MPNYESEKLNTTTNTGVAAAMATTPFWLDWLRSASEVAALVAPLLGVFWLGFQIWAKYQEIRGAKKK